MSEVPEAAVPVPSSDDYPYVHVGHGISVARKSWGMLVVLREPLACGIPEGVPQPLDVDTQTGRRTVELSHDDDSLERVVAATYDPGSGLGDDDGATGDQWEEFNADLDRFLARLHERAPIAVAIRSVVDGEAADFLSPWHTWSCHQLPRFLPFLAETLSGVKGDRRYLKHACRLWREWNASLPVAQQLSAIDVLPTGVREVFARFGGLPQPDLKEVELLLSTYSYAPDVLATLLGGADTSLGSLLQRDDVRALLTEAADDSGSRSAVRDDR
jgi:hypothetical protein